MKIFIVLFASAALVSANTVDEKALKKAETENFLMKIAGECSEEIGFNLQTAVKLLRGDFTDRSTQAKCFMKCFFIKEGFMNQQAEPMKDFMVTSLLDTTTLKRAQLAGIIDNCTEFKGNDACENAYQLLECYTTDKDIVAATIP